MTVTLLRYDKCGTVPLDPKSFFS